jgi:hypothetical protein
MHISFSLAPQHWHMAFHISIMHNGHLLSSSDPRNVPMQTPEDFSPLDCTAEPSHLHLLTLSSIKYFDTSSSYQSNQQVPINGKRVENVPGHHPYYAFFIPSRIMLYSYCEIMSSFIADIKGAKGGDRPTNLSRGRSSADASRHLPSKRDHCGRRAALIHVRSLQPIYMLASHLPPHPQGTTSKCRHIHTTSSGQRHRRVLYL